MAVLNRIQEKLCDTFCYRVLVGGMKYTSTHTSYRDPHTLQFAMPLKFSNELLSYLIDML